MPCEYSYVRIEERNRSNEVARQRAEERERQRKAEIMRKKQAIIVALASMNFDVSMSPAGDQQTLILGTDGGQQMEVLFNESTGDFMTHFSGVPNHSEEHRLLDKFMETLRNNGFKTDVHHHHEKPKLPVIEVNDEDV